LLPRPRTANIFFPHLKPRERTGWRGGLHRLLTRLGPTWRSAPLRRLAQAACLALFLYAFFCVCWPYSSQFSSTTLSEKEWFPAEGFLLLDPLSGVSTALAGRALHWPTLRWTVAVILVCLLVPRAFCGYVCPLGTLIDLFDWLVGRRFRRLHLDPHGLAKATKWWAHAKYYLLGVVLAAALGGVLLSGFVAAIPVLTRALLFSGGRWQIATMKGPSHLLPVDWTFYLSLALFAAVFLAGLLGKRFWCRYVCPTGALFSVFHVFRVGQRKVAGTCVGCGKCADVCPFDAVREDFTTRTSQCAWCQSCGGVCPAQAIEFGTRWGNEPRARAEDVQVAAQVEGPPETIPPPRPPLSRRGFVAASLFGATAAMTRLASPRQPATDCPRPVRPPGSVAEEEFLGLCVRCGECFKVCPGPVLHPAGFEYGFGSLWTPVARLEHAGCHQDCNFCTQVCPTGAIQPLDISTKRRTRMGLARIDAAACLPLRQDQLRQECDLCFVECQRAGYDAIEMREVRIELEPPPPAGAFSEMELDALTRIRVPVVKADACVGCGICQYRCHTRYVLQEHRLTESAVRVAAENHVRQAFQPDFSGRSG
jgi:ferredoxin